MARGGDGMVDVELDEPPADGAPAVAGPRPQEPRGPLLQRLRQTLRRRWPVAVVVLLVLGVAARVSGASAVRDDADVVARFADVPGVAPSLREPPHEAWRLAARVQTVVGLALTHEADDGVVLTARDAAGAVRWTVPLPVGPSAPAAGGARPECLATAEGLLVCEVAGGGVRAPNTDVVLSGSPDLLVVLDPSDGSLVRISERPAGTVAVAPLEDDLVTAVVSDGEVRVERADARTGDARWSTPLPQLLPEGISADGLVLEVGAGLVVVEGALGAVLAPDGSLVGAWPRPPAGAITVDPTAVGFTVWRPAVGGSWFTRDGSVAAWFPGDPVGAEVSDGSAPEVVLARVDGSLQAVDVRAGFRMWTRSGVERVVARIDGLVALEGDGALRVVDLRTGELVWSVGVPLDRGPDQAAVTDGVRLLVVRVGQDGGRRLVAHDLRTGAERWSRPLEPGRAGPAVEGGMLVSREEGEHVVWAP